MSGRSLNGKYDFRKINLHHLKEDSPDDFSDLETPMVSNFYERVRYAQLATCQVTKNAGNEPENVRNGEIAPLTLHSRPLCSCNIFFAKNDLCFTIEWSLEMNGMSQ